MPSYPLTSVKIKTILGSNIVGKIMSLDLSRDESAGTDARNSQDA